MFIKRVLAKYKIGAEDRIPLQDDQQEREPLTPERLDKYKKYLNYGFEAQKAGRDLGDELQVKSVTPQQVLNEKARAFKAFLKKSKDHIEKAALHKSNIPQLDEALLKTQFDRGFKESYESHYDA
jgi:hypothetical protein